MDIWNTIIPNITCEEEGPDGREKLGGEYIAECNNIVHKQVERTIIQGENKREREGGRGWEHTE